MRYGYFLAAVAPSGRVATGLYDRAEGEPPFDARDLMAGEALSPVIAAALDREPGPSSSPEIAVDEAQIAFDRDGRLVSFGVSGAERLRDAGNGGPGAFAALRERAEAAARDLLADAAAAREPETVAAQAEAELRRGLARMELRGREHRGSKVLARSRFGAFELDLTATAEADGGLRALGRLRRRGPRALAILRALIESEAPAREFDLARELDQGKTIAEAARGLGVAPSTAETLAERLYERFGASGRDGLIEAMVEAGRAAAR